MTASATSSVTVPRRIADKGYAGRFTGELNNYIGIAMGCSVARAMVRVARTVCSVTGGTGGKTGM
jgi:hypothetical protein